MHDPCGIGWDRKDAAQGGRTARMRPTSINQSDPARANLCESHTNPNAAQLKPTKPTRPSRTQHSPTQSRPRAPPNNSLARIRIHKLVVPGVSSPIHAAIGCRSEKMVSNMCTKRESHASQSNPTRPQSNRTKAHPPRSKPTSPNPIQHDPTQPKSEPLPLPPFKKMICIRCIMHQLQ